MKSLEFIHHEALSVLPQEQAGCWQSFVQAPGGSYYWAFFFSPKICFSTSFEMSSILAVRRKGINGINIFAVTCNRPSAFQCYDGRCIPWEARCDIVKDCSGCNDEDEQGCISAPFDICQGIQSSNNISSNQAINFLFFGSQNLPTICLCRSAVGRKNQNQNQVSKFIFPLVKHSACLI